MTSLFAAHPALQTAGWCAFGAILPILLFGSSLRDSLFTKDDTSCSPTTYPQTFLFAYSNDLSQKTVLDTWYTFKQFSDQHSEHYTWYGIARFDTPNMDIQFDTNLDDTTLTVQKILPDPNQGFQNSSIGSNVFHAIEKFFSNTEASVCGPNILVLLKRYPNEEDISRLVSLIRSHHAVVHVITSTTPSGGSQPKAMYSVASKTNGMGLIENDEDFDRLAWYFSFYESPYPVYATTIQASGSGTKTLPDFYNKGILAKKYLISITYQDHVPIDSFRNLNLHWTSPEGSGNYKIPRDSGKFRAIYFCPQDIEDLRRVNTISYNMQYNFAIDRLHFLDADYKMTLDYNYTGSDVQNFQLRIYSSSPSSKWLPYSD
ncbi:unnamed protein product [Caenorhabditis nigoni]